MQITTNAVSMCANPARINTLAKSTALIRAFFLIAIFLSLGSAALATTVNVKDPQFGATGNGATNDGPAIQNAINSLAPYGGGTVYFPSGIYNVEQTIDVPPNVRLQGSGSTVFGTQIRLIGINKNLFELNTYRGRGPTTGMIFKDLLLIAQGASGVWPRNEPDETEKIRTENTTAIAFNGIEGRLTSNIVIENVRITEFHYGIRATAQGEVTDVKIRNYASDGNEYALYVDNPAAHDWDIQNMNAFVMYDQQKGIKIIRSGDMNFLQFSCAGATTAGPCATLQQHGNLYFRQLHNEGSPVTVLVEPYCEGLICYENNAWLTIENSAVDGQINRKTNINAINNRFYLANVNPFHFSGTGTESVVKLCGNVWFADNHLLATTYVPSGAFADLAAPADVKCRQNRLYPAPAFQTGFTPDVAINNLEFEVDVTHEGATTTPGDDDTEGFQKAILAARASRSKRVFVPAGEYDIFGTLDLQKGESIVGVTQNDKPASIIRLHANIPYGFMPLIRVFNDPTTGDLIRGVTIRNLELVTTSARTVGIDFECYDLNDEGGASDFQLQNLSIKGFETGIIVQPHLGVLPGVNNQPMFDSVSIKKVEFTDNKTAMIFRSGNASNWNLEDLIVHIPDDGEGIRVDFGNPSIRNMHCAGTGRSNDCLIIQRQSGMSVQNLTATGVTNALYVPWENGFTPLPVTIRDSDLTAGVYIEGRIFLNSVNNTYPAQLSENSTSKIVRFLGTNPDLPPYQAPGSTSQIYSCNDTFLDTDSQMTTTEWDYVGPLTETINTCN